MEFLLFVIFFAVVGLLFGSFAGASVWRLRANQLVEDEAAGEKISKKELRPLRKIAGRAVSNDRSQCLHCGHKLAWYDLIPLVSWVQLGGKCRYCKKRIGWFEPVVELTTALFFVLSFIALPHETLLQWTLLVLWLVGGVGMVILFWYDTKWSLLPNKVVFPVIGIAGVSAAITILSAVSITESAVSALVACVVLSGLYYGLYLVSKGAWVGFGDIKLGLALALFLADWQLALLTLFLANLIGCLIVLPGMVAGRLGRYSHVPFGPMLIAAWVIAGLYGHHMIEWYMSWTLSFYG